MNLMLLCAGEGTRFNPYTLKRPKPAIPMLGVPMLYWSLDHAMHLQPQNIVCNVSHLASQVEALVEVAALRLQREIKISRETPKPFESGGGLRNAKGLLAPGEDILLCNADEVTLFNDAAVFKKFLQFHRETKSFATLLTTHNPLVGSKFGGVWAQNSKVLGFGKQALANTKGWHYVGAMLLNFEILKYLPNQQNSNIIYDGLVNALAAGKEVHHYSAEAAWFETGNLQDYLAASHKLVGELASHTQIGAEIQKLREFWLGPQATHIYTSDKYRVVVEQPLPQSILQNFMGNNVVGRNCQFLDSFKVQDSVLCSGSKIDRDIKNELVL